MGIIIRFPTERIKPTQGKLTRKVKKRKVARSAADPQVYTSSSARLSRVVELRRRYPERSLADIVREVDSARL